MSKSNQTFLSSTAWTERIGFVAALETIKFMKKNKVPLIIKKRGVKIIEGWKLIAKRHQLKIKTNNFYSMPTFNFDYSKKSEILHTLFTEYMLNKGYISTNYMFVSYAHTNDAIDKYLKICDQVFKKIKKDLKEKKILRNMISRKMTY